MNETQEIIGLTGNIATGKSVIRRMLANCGALEIDADMIAHRIMYPGGPAYPKIVDAFGETILADDGSISRGKLAEIVFNDLEKLKQLEAISHPIVTDAIMAHVRLSEQNMVVIEAIKLLEAGLDAVCTSIWVSYASKSYQLERLINQRGLTESQAQVRISAQPSQFKKIIRADVVINTEGSFQSTWDQVRGSLNDTIQGKQHPEETHLNSSSGWKSTPIHPLAHHELEAFWLANKKDENLSFFEQSGSDMILPVMRDKLLSNLIIWDNWNFTGTMQAVLPKPGSAESHSMLIELFQAHAESQQCEILLIPDKCVKELDLSPGDFGFHYMPVEQIAYPAWREACNAINNEDENAIWIKILAQPMEQVVNFKVT